MENNENKSGDEINTQRNVKLLVFSVGGNQELIQIPIDDTLDILTTIVKVSRWSWHCIKGGAVVIAVYCFDLVFGYYTVIQILGYNEVSTNVKLKSFCCHLFSLCSGNDVAGKYRQNFPTSLSSGHYGMT